MKLAGLGKLYAMLYVDKMHIYRPTSKINDDGTTSISYGTPKYTDIKCRLSFSSSDSASDSEVDRNPVRFNAKIICAHNIDLRAGDYVVVRRYADNGVAIKTYQGQVAHPSWYTTHQEAFLHMDEGA